MPPRALSPNGNGASQRIAKARYTRPYREQVAYEARNAMPAEWEPCRARVALTFGTATRPGDREREQLWPPEQQPYRARDVWNFIAAWKPGFDGLSDAGVWPDDSAQWAVLGTTMVDPRLAPGVRVFIEQWWR